ncbi:MAG: RNA methyltransferase [Bacteroidetes bacterium]|nr:RNA methyltransferase [Bacteroidota bacterium]
MLSNAEIKSLSELKDKKGREAHKKFLIEGKRALLEALSGNANISRIIVSLGSNPSKFADIFLAAEEKGITIEEVPVAKFNKLSSTETSQGIIAIAGVRNLTSDDLIAEIRSKRSATVLLLDRISDPGNLGTILRSAAWFGVDGVVIAGGSVDAYNPKVVRSAMSAICQLNVLQDVALVDEITRLKALGFAVVASTQEAALSYADFAYPKRAAIVFGAEATGISSEVLKLCETQIAIPRAGKMESLNVGVAASIVLAEIMRQKSMGRR